MSSLDDDEALFQDIYADNDNEEQVNNEGKEPTATAFASTASDAATAPTTTTAVATPPSATEVQNESTAELHDAAAATITPVSNGVEVGASNPVPAEPQQQQQQQQQDPAGSVIAGQGQPVIPQQFPPLATLPPVQGLTSIAIGDQLKQKSQYFNRDQGKMFVGGLNWETSEEKLVDYFGKYGEIISYKIMRDNHTGVSRGFGFLTFKDGSSVDEVLKTRHVLDGKVIDPKRAIPKEEQSNTGKIFVGGISLDVTEKDFDEFFSKFGNVIDAQLMIDKDTKKSRGFGFVTYDSPEAVDRVCQNKYIELKGKQMEIKRAEPRGQQQQRLGGIKGFNAQTAYQLNRQNMYNNSSTPGYMMGNFGQVQQQPAMFGAPGAIDPSSQQQQLMVQQYWQYCVQQMTPQQLQQLQQLNPQQMMEYQSAVYAQAMQAASAMNSGADSASSANSAATSSSSHINSDSIATAAGDENNERPIVLHSASETSSDSPVEGHGYNGENDNSYNNGGSGNNKKFDFPSGPKNSRGGHNNNGYRGRGGRGGRGGYNRKYNYHPYR